MQAIADTAALINAYLRERAGYARAGASDRVAQVDAQLALLGYAAPPQEGAQRTAEDPAPAARRAPRKPTSKE